MKIRNNKRITKELKHLLQNELVLQNGTRGGAYYTLVMKSQQSDEQSSPLNEQRLLSISEIARGKKRLDPKEMNNLILKLCEIKSLTLKELCDLLDRKPKPLREKYLAKLVIEGKLRLLYPDHANHPKQAYMKT